MQAAGEKVFIVSCAILRMLNSLPGYLCAFHSFYTLFYLFIFIGAIIICLAGR